MNLRELSGIIGADPCQVAMWLYRGKGPPSLPSAWFTSGVRVFRLSAVQTWLSGDEEPEWRIWQRTIAETLGELDLDEVACHARSAELVALLGEKAICPAGSSWKKGGFRTYVESISDADRSMSFLLPTMDG